MTSITIRRASLDDAAMLSEIARQTYVDTFAEGSNPTEMAIHLTKTYSLEKQAAQLADSHVTVYFAEVAGDTVGYVMLDDDEVPACVTLPKAVRLSRIYVRQAWIGKGVGAALMQAALDHAATQGHQGIWLGVWKENHRAIGFYTAWGFEPVGTITFQFGTKSVADMVWQRPIDPQTRGDDEA